MSKTIQELEVQAVNIRKSVLEMIKRAKTGHTGSDLSCTDILVSLYYHVLNVSAKAPNNPDRDRYIQSKGHAAEVAGIEMNTGSLGHGLSVSVGIALAAKLDKKDYQTYTLLGDGELAEGSVWEGAMAAAHYKLDNLTAIIDRNGLQISGESEDVMGVNPLDKKFEAFGWQVIEVKDGNDIAALIAAFETPHQPGKPKMIIAHTVKGKGVSFAENQAAWHHKVPTDNEYEQAFNELNQQLEVIANGN